MPEIKEDNGYMSFVGHDNYIYDISRSYRGSGHIYLSKHFKGSPYSATISIHIDDIDSIIEMLKKAKVG